MQNYQKFLISEQDQEVINYFKKESGKKLIYKTIARRVGEATEVYAKTDKKNSVLGWKTVPTLDEAVASAWKWKHKIRNK